MKIPSGQTALFLSAAAVALVCTAVPRAQSPACSGCQSLKARYWLVDKDDYKATGEPPFPERDRLKLRTDDVGLAFSGGGTRSATATLGELRGMNQNGWLGRVRYVSAVSGGAWAAIPFAYSALGLTELLGTTEDVHATAPPFNPDDFLKKPNGALAKAIAESSLTASAFLEAGTIAAQFNLSKLSSDKFHLQTFLDLANHFRREPGRMDKTYTRLIGRAFIDKLIEPGKSTSDQLFSWDAASLGGMPADAIVQLGSISLAHTDRPFLIAGGTAVYRKPGDKAFPQLMPVEYTSMYVGVRQQFDPGFGGSYIEPWAYDPEEIGASPEANPADARTGLVRVTFNPSRRFTLADVAASTGAAPELLTITGGPVPEQYQSYIQQGAQVFPAFRHVSVRSATSASATTDVVPHADGGASDNLGVMPLLARQTTNVLVFINTNNRYASTNDDLRSLFIPIGPPTADGDKRHNVVFGPPDGNQDLYDRVIKGLNDAQQQQRPLVFCDTNWEVHANQHYNIRGYKNLNICFVYNAAVPLWTNALPPPLKEAVARSGDFPWFATFGQNKPHLIQLKPDQVNLLANLMACVMTDTTTVDTIRRAIPKLPPPPATKPCWP